MVQEQIIEAIRKKQSSTGFEKRPPATTDQVAAFESAFGHRLPNDFKSFYSFCNGFWIGEDDFNFIAIENVLDHEDHYGRNWFYFAEYMTFCDMWAVRVTDTDRYEIYNSSRPEIVLTDSLAAFLERLIRGHVFETGGLIDWMAEVSSL
jgi:hypothetical protein